VSEWVSEWMSEWVKGWVGKWMGGQVNEIMSGCIIEERKEWNIKNHLLFEHAPVLLVAVWDDYPDRMEIQR